MPETMKIKNKNNTTGLVSRLPENCDPKLLSREIGMEIASLCGKHFLKLNHLHYGYWPRELEVDITNLHIAQEKYTEFLLSHIDENVSTILDVGCGNGQNAKRLIDEGYKVDCVSPSPTLYRQTKELLGPESTIYHTYYEDLVTDKKYDLILFSESFQYLKIEKAVNKTHSLLNDNGYMMICDIFKKDVEGKCPMPGGHRLSAFLDVVSEYPFELVKEIDITEETALNIDIENKLFMEVGLPSWEMLNQLMYSRHPLMAKFLNWKFKKKIAKLHKKYFNGNRTGEMFKKYKSYLLLTYRKAIKTSIETDDYPDISEMFISDTPEVSNVPS